jgi:putative colanic acid biosynthesis acetyltransferase WcaF
MIDGFRRDVSFAQRAYSAAWIIISGVFFESFLPLPSYFKVLLLSLFGAKVGRSVVIRPGVYIKNPRLMIIGNHVWIGRGVFIDNDEVVEISSNVCISQRTNIITGSHDYFSPNFDYFGKKIFISNNVWIAAAVTVLGGSNISSNVFIATGCVISGSIPSNRRVVYGGNGMGVETSGLLP